MGGNIFRLQYKEQNSYKFNTKSAILEKIIEKHNRKILNSKQTNVTNYGGFSFKRKLQHLMTLHQRIVYRLTHSASELSGFTVTMNEKFQYR